MSRGKITFFMKPGEKGFRVELPSELIERFHLACKNHKPKVTFRAVSEMLIREWTERQEATQQSRRKGTWVKGKEPGQQHGEAEGQG